MMILKAVATLSVVGVGAAAAAFGGLHLGQAPAGAGPAAQPVKAQAACTVAPAVKLAARPAAKRIAKPACGDRRSAEPPPGPFTMARRCGSTSGRRHTSGSTAPTVS